MSSSASNLVSSLDGACRPFNSSSRAGAAGFRPTSEAPDRIKICLVTSFPPSKNDLNEYGYHLARAMQDDPRVELTILADQVPDRHELPGFHVERCWHFDSRFNVVRLLRTIRTESPDVVWFNIGFSTMAREPVAAFLAMTIPAIARLLGFYTHITLHTVFERIDLKDAGVRWQGVYRAAGRLATRLLLLAHDTTVLLPSFRAELLDKYGVDGQRVHFQPHGTFAAGDFVPAPREQKEPVILAFGYWGTYKRLESLLEAMDLVASEFPNATLLVAGSSHPSAPGYIESLRQQCNEHNRVRFLGYVPEAELQAVFTNASVLVLPYSSAAGASGVVHQGCEFGTPMVAADIPEIRESAREEGIAIHFYPPGDSGALAKQLISLLCSPELRRTVSGQNLAVARRMRLSHVVDEYLALFQTRLQPKEVATSN